MSGTDFNFGWNATADNADPWGLNHKDTGDVDANGKHLPTCFCLDCVAKSETKADENCVDINIAEVENVVRKQLFGLMRELKKGTKLDIQLPVRWICGVVRKQIEEKLFIGGSTAMPSAAALLKSKSNGEGGNLLHGSDVPKKTKEFDIVIVGFREAPTGFEGAIGLLDIKPVFDCQCWALNKTNFKAVMNALGDNTDKWNGKKLRLQVIQVRNPKAGTIGPSLAVVQ